MTNKAPHAPGCLPIISYYNFDVGAKLLLEVANPPICFQRKWDFGDMPWSISVHSAVSKQTKASRLFTASQIFNLENNASQIVGLQRSFPNFLKYRIQLCLISGAILGRDLN